MESVKGKNILITGATGGIGRHTAKLLAGSGANIFITGRDSDKLQQLANELSLPAHCLLAADLTLPEAVEQLKNQYFSVYESIDVLVNASGIGIIKQLEQLSSEEFLKTNIPGVLGKVPMAGAAAYSASKYGLVGMMQSVREELKRTDIRITSIYMGGVDSAFWDTIDLRVQRDKMIRPEEAAKAIWFLCQQPASGVVSEMVLQPFNHQAI